MAELGYRNIYEVTGGKFTLTRFERDRVSGRKLVRETYVTGQQFTAYNYEVPAGFMDLVKVVGPAPEEKPVPPPKREVPTEDRDGKYGKETTTRGRKSPEPPKKKSSEKPLPEEKEVAEVKTKAKAKVTKVKAAKKGEDKPVPLPRVRRRK